MKIGIEQDVLKMALEKGALASLSDEAKTETSSMATLIKAVKITVDENLTIESATQLLGTRYSIPATKEGGIDVKETGVIMVSAQELYDWVSRQAKSKIVMSLDKLEIPEMITLDDEDDGQNVIKKIGSLKLASRDESKTGAKWALDCYDASQASLVDFSKKPETLFGVEAKLLKTGLKNIAFSASKKDDKHVWDGISFQTYKEKLYMLATDCTRLAVYDLDVKNNKLDMNLLMPSVLLASVMKIIDNASMLKFGYNKDDARAYIFTSNMDIRFATADPSQVSKFLPIDTIIQKDYSPFVKINKKLLSQRLMSVAMAKSSNALLTFKEETLLLHVISESGYKPSFATVPINKVAEEFKDVFSIGHILDVIKAITSDELEINIPENKKSLKLTTSDNERVSYYIMTVATPLYRDQ